MNQEPQTEPLNPLILSELKINKTNMDDTIFKRTKLQKYTLVPPEALTTGCWFRYTRPKFNSDNERQCVFGKYLGRNEEGNLRVQGYKSEQTWVIQINKSWSNQINFYLPN